MIREHAAAVAAFLAALGVTVYDTDAGRTFDGGEEVPDFPYAVIAVASPVRSTDRMVQARERHELDVTVGSHGLTPASARWVAEHVAQLAGATLAVPGWTAQIESITSSLVRKDDDNPEQVVFSGFDGFTVTTFPA